MDLTLTALVDSYFETADTLLTKVKRNAGKHDFSEMFLLFDILENLMSVRGEWNDIFGVRILLCIFQPSSRKLTFELPQYR